MDAKPNKSVFMEKSNLENCFLLFEPFVGISNYVLSGICSLNSTHTTHQINMMMFRKKQISKMCL